MVVALKGVLKRGVLWILQTQSSLRLFLQMAYPAFNDVHLRHDLFDLRNQPAVSTLASHLQGSGQLVQPCCIAHVHLKDRGGFVPSGSTAAKTGEGHYTLCWLGTLQKGFSSFHSHCTHLHLLLKARGDCDYRGAHGVDGETTSRGL